jgi:hypothetical protein
MYCVWGKDVTNVRCDAWVIPSMLTLVKCAGLWEDPMLFGLMLVQWLVLGTRTERACLTFLTAMLEGQHPAIVEHVRTSIDAPILFQVSLW